MKMMKKVKVVIIVRMNMMILSMIKEVQEMIMKKITILIL
jgi:hypothetical protein